jgi:hypothetical protein
VSRGAGTAARRCRAHWPRCDRATVRRRPHPIRRRRGRAGRRRGRRGAQTRAATRAGHGRAGRVTAPFAVGCGACGSLARARRACGLGGLPAQRACLLRPDAAVSEQRDQQRRGAGSGTPGSLRRSPAAGPHLPRARLRRCPADAPRPRSRQLRGRMMPRLGRGNPSVAYSASTARARSYPAGRPPQTRP